MPQYNEQQIMDWFKSVAGGGAVLNNGYLTTEKVNMEKWI